MPKTKELCDNTDCENPNKQQTTFLTLLRKEFEYDVCHWCADCIEIDEAMIEMDEWSIMKLHKEKMRH